MNKECFVETSEIFFCIFIENPCTNLGNNLATYGTEKKQFFKSLLICNYTVPLSNVVR